MASVTNLFNQLKLQQDNEDHLQVYETSSKILESSPFELAVLKTCLIALINLDNYNLALNVLTKYPTEKSDLVLEKSYIYYKSNKAQLLEEILDQDLQQNRGLLHLKAQFFYQQGANAKALELYKELIETSPEDEVLDLSVNERAVIAQSLMMTGDIIDATPFSADDSTSYDLLFNNSLIQLNKGDLQESLESLEAAKLKCEESASNYNDDEKFTELFPILLQTSFVYFQIGEIAKSEEILVNLMNEINAYENDDKLAKLLILNNLYSIKLLSSKINSNLIYSNLQFPNVFKQITLTIPQLKKLQSNERILSLSNGKTGNDKLFELISEIDFDTDEKTIAKKLFRLASQDKNLALNLLAIQYNNQIKNFDNSYLLINKLITDELLSQVPSLITIQIFIYENLNKSIEELLTNFTSSVDTQDLSKSSTYKIFKEVCFKLLSIKQDAQAAELASKLYKVNSNDKLISVLVNKESAELTSVETLISGIDAQELISRGIVEDESNLKTSTKTRSNRVSKQNKYKRRKKIPEHLVNKTVDPERWLPLKDRSYYKPKKGKKINATQGGSADNSTEMNIASAPASTPSSSGSSKSKNQKKKGKKRH